MRVATMILALAAIWAWSAGGVAAQGTPTFDGAWNVAVSCGTAADGARGYNWKFPATVANNMLHGQYGTDDSPSSMSLDGTIGADGNALLFAYGSTGNPAYSVKRVKPGSPFQYHARVHFTGTHGEGTRIELRPCTLTFDKL